MKKSLGSPTTSGRMVAWSIELSEYDVQFEPRTTIKAQALADFLLESSSPDSDLADLDTPNRPTSPKQTKQQAAAPPHSCPENDSPEVASWWELKVDGSSSEAGSGAGVVLRSPEGATTEQSIAFEFPASNNEAEYEALIAGLRAALAIKAENLSVLADSQLVVHQVNGKYAAKDKRMAQYLKIVKELIVRFTNFKIAQVPRALNARADALSKLASTSSIGGSGPIFADTLRRPSIAAAPSAVMQTDASAASSWMDPIIQFLTNGVLPADAAEARSLRRSSRRYLMIDDQLYRSSYQSSGVGPYLRCLRPDEARYVLREIHEGVCGNHPGARALAQKIIR